MLPLTQEVFGYGMTRSIARRNKIFDVLPDAKSVDNQHRCLDRPAATTFSFIASAGVVDVPYE